MQWLITFHNLTENQKQKLQILSFLLQLSQDFFYSFIKISSAFVQNFCWFIICRWCWVSVEQDWGEIEANSQLLQGGSSMAVRVICWFKCVRAGLASSFTFHNNVLRLFSRSKANCSRFHCCHGKKVKTRSSLFREFCCGYGRTFIVDHVSICSLKFHWELAELSSIEV